MKKILISLATLLLVINFIGCSNDGSSDTSSNKGEVVEAMVIDVNYTLAIGDKLNRLTDNATIEITQNSKENEAVYTLIMGEAEIVRY